jgi:hypothetical protein
MVDLAFTPFSELDLASSLKEIESALGESIFDSFSYLDPERAIRQIEAATGQSFFDPYGVLDPARALKEIEAAVNAGGSYHAPAVHFDGATWFQNAAFSCADSFDVSCVYFFKVPDNGGGPLFCTDPDVTANNLFSTFASGTDVTLDYELGNIPFTDTIEPNSGFLSSLTGAWHSLIFSANTNHAPDECVAKIYLDDVSVPFDLNSSGNDPFRGAFNAVKMVFGTDGFNIFTGDMAIFRLFIGTSLLDGGGDIPVITRRLFVDASNKPVDPATATASLGAAGTILFNGDASTFATNQGNGGYFTLEAGSLANASTSPSD